MKNIIFKSLIIISFLFSSIVFAMGLDEAKDRGLVGEKDNGYLGLVVAQNNPRNDLRDDTQSLVDDINAKRKAVYVKLAAKNGITLAQLETLAAEKTYSKTNTGHYLWASGKWTKK